MKRFLSLLVFCFATSAFAVQVSGTALLEDWIGHTGICVLFEAVSPSAQTDSVSTNIDGQYNLDLEPGIYDAIFSYPEFRTDTIHSQPITGPTLIPVVILIPFHESLAGDLSGETGPGTYRVVNDITVRQGETLDVAPGTQILFTGDYSFVVSGRLTASGTESDSIVFSTLADTVHWQGLKFNNLGNSSLKCCLIENVGPSDTRELPLAAILVENANLSISNSTISNNSGSETGGIYASRGGIEIDHCVITANSGNVGGLYIIFYSMVNIKNCAIVGNSSVNSEGGAISLYDSQFEMTNTIVADNEGFAIRVPGWGDNSSINYNLFYGNSDGTYRPEDDLPPLWGQLITSNANGDSCDTYYNIFEEPLFVDAANGDYHLQQGSPCIDAGDPLLPFDPDNTVADIGAFYYPQPEATRENNLPLPTDIVLHQNYPNPFNATTNIELEIPSSGLVHLELFDIQGRHTSILLDDRLPAGAHRIGFDGSKLPSGVYFYRLSAQDKSQIRKMILIK